MGTCPTVRGQLNGSFPPGETSPNSRFATAAPPCVPGYQMSRIAGTFSAAQRRSSGRPFMTSNTVGVPVATTACSSSSWRPGSSSDDREAASPIMFCHSPATTTATSAPLARSTARRNSASSSKPAGSSWPVAAEHVEHRGEHSLHDPDAGGVVHLYPVRRPSAGCRRGRSRSRPGRSRTPTDPGCRGVSRRAGRSPRRT